MINTAQDWEAFARSLVHQVAADLRAKVEEKRLTEVLLLFTISAANPRAATIHVLVSPGDAIVSAGEGSRFELPSLPEGESEVRQVVRAIAHGRLTESIRGRRIQGSVALDDGRVLRSDVWDAQRRSERKRMAEYEPFDQPGP
ncbi:MAG: hypothetical protein QOI54_3387 [Actinomycetota bacterium]|nr:hypothetical protein [Actinomycetota bacterium]